MRAQTPAPLTLADLDAIVDRLLFKLRDVVVVPAPAADPDQLLDWEGVALEIMRFRAPGAPRVVRQTVWKMVADGRLPQPCHRPNARVARWRRGDVVARLSKNKI